VQSIVLLYGGAGFLAGLAAGFVLAPWQRAAPFLFAAGVAVFLAWTGVSAWIGALPDGVVGALVGFFNLLGWLAASALGIVGRRALRRRSADLALDV
jgi:hypothetical protein